PRRAAQTRRPAAGPPERRALAAPRGPDTRGDPRRAPARCREHRELPRRAADRRRRRPARVGPTVAVVALETQARSAVLDGRPFGAVGPYEKLEGTLRFAVDPAHPENQPITDLGLAPKNARGLVEASADFYLLRPVDPARGNRRLLLDVPNRGRKVALAMFNSAPRVPDPSTPEDFGNGFLMRHGYTVAWGAWRFADASHASLEGGYEPGKIYELVYRSANPPLVGLGFLAVRDGAAWLRFAPAAEGNPCAGVLDRAYAFGVSQSGRFLRHLLYLGLTEAESGHPVFDAVIPHVAGARRGEFNHRFGQPSLNATHAVGSLFPFADTVETDPVTGERGALLARLAA